MKLTALKIAWKKRVALWAKSDALMAKGNALWAKSDALWAKSYTLRAKSDTLWAKAIIEIKGNIKIEWKWIPAKNDYSCTLETGEVFEP